MTRGRGPNGRVGAAALLMSLLGIAGQGCSAGNSSPNPAATAQATGTSGAEAAVGERLFLETRFAQSFKRFLDNGGDVNDPRVGDPVVDAVETPTIPMAPGPFKGRSMNCRSCHMIDDVLALPGGAMRAYADFARRSPIPDRHDGKTHAPRNSPPLVNSSLERPGGIVLHFDAEFNSMEELVAATFTGRNFGWLPNEKTQAIAHVARIVRGDDGSDDLAQQFGGVPYRLLLSSTGDIPEELRLPKDFRVLVGSGTDQEIFNAVVKLVAAYVNGLRFSQTDDAGSLIRSPYDVFLERNGLPQQPDPNETPIIYSRRLRTLLNAPGFVPQFVTANPNRPDGRFRFHPGQNFEFGATELEGLKIFLAEPTTLPPSAGELAAGTIGNCVTCHAAPHFTDFKLHNTGATQREYDAIHGPGQFSGLAIPDLSARNGSHNQFLPATEIHPAALEPFRAVPSVGNAGLTDLGVWNIFANPDMPGPQAKIRAMLCDDLQPCPLPDAALLDRAVARFKTPGLRDLGHSAPYMHTGQFDTVEDIIGFYRGISNQARGGTLRNGDAQLQGIALTAGDTTALAAFLKSLNEDYQ